MGKQEKAQAQGKAYTEYVMSFLDEGARAAVDAAGYELLRRHGFDVTGVDASEGARKRLAASMERRRTSLQYYAVPSEETRSNIIIFELVVNGRVRDKQAVRIEYQDKEGAEPNEGAGDQA